MRGRRGCHNLVHAGGASSLYDFRVLVMAETAGCSLGMVLDRWAIPVIRVVGEASLLLLPALAGAIYGSTCKAENEISNVVYDRCFTGIQIALT